MCLTGPPWRGAGVTEYVGHWSVDFVRSQTEIDLLQDLHFSLGRIYALRLYIWPADGVSLGGTFGPDGDAGRDPDPKGDRALRSTAIRARVAAGSAWDGLRELRTARRDTPSS